MKVVFWSSDKSREHMLAAAIGKAIMADGHSYQVLRTADYGEDREHEGPVPGTELALVFGVKGKSAEIIKDHRMIDVPVLYLDKGISRHKGEGGHTEFTRIFINGGSPDAYMMERKYRPDRFDDLRYRMEPRRERGDYVLFCGSSQKYHDFHGLPPSQRYAEWVVKQLRKLTEQTIVYRPKPSDHAARSISGAVHSHGTTQFGDALRRASVMVTHGSSAAVYAILGGVPVISLGQSITSPVAESEIGNVGDPFWPDEQLRRRWANAMAYCQWTTKELRDGSAWEHLREELKRQCG